MPVISKDKALSYRLEFRAPGDNVWWRWEKYHDGGWVARKRKDVTTYLDEVKAIPMYANYEFRIRERCVTTTVEENVVD